MLDAVLVISAVLWVGAGGSGGLSGVPAVAAAAKLAPLEEDWGTLLNGTVAVVDEAVVFPSALGSTVTAAAGGE